MQRNAASCTDDIDGNHCSLSDCESTMTTLLSIGIDRLCKKVFFTLKSHHYISSQKFTQNLKNADNNLEYSFC